MDIVSRVRLQGGQPLPAQLVASTNAIETLGVFSAFYAIKQLPVATRLTAAEFSNLIAGQLRKSMLENNLVAERSKLYPAANNTVITVWADRTIVDTSTNAFTVTYTVEVEER